MLFRSQATNKYRIDQPTVLKMLQANSNVHAAHSKSILKQQAEREASESSAPTKEIATSSTYKKRKVLTDEEELYEGDDDIVQWSAQVFAMNKAAQAEEQEEPIPFEGSKEEKDFLDIIRRKVEPISFSPLDSVVKSQMTQDFLKEVIRVLGEKKNPYWSGFFQEIGRAHV